MIEKIEDLKTDIQQQSRMLSVMLKTLIEGRQFEQINLKKLKKQGELMRSFPLPLKTADDVIELEKKLEEDNAAHFFLVSGIRHFYTVA